MTTDTKRILIMDDELYICELLQDMMGMLGYFAIVTQEGQQAIDAYRQAQDSGKQFSAVIMDLTVPVGLGGKDAIVEILKIDPDARSIVASGYSAENILANYGEFGFSAILQKPFRFEEISQTLNGIMR